MGTHICAHTHTRTHIYMHAHTQAHTYTCRSIMHPLLRRTHPGYSAHIQCNSTPAIRRQQCAKETASLGEKAPDQEVGEKRGRENLDTKLAEFKWSKTIKRTGRCYTRRERKQSLPASAGQNLQRAHIITEHFP